MPKSPCVANRFSIIIIVRTAEHMTEREKMNTIHKPKTIVKKDAQSHTLLCSEEVER